MLLCRAYPRHSAWRFHNATGTLALPSPPARSYNYPCNGIGFFTGPGDSSLRSSSSSLFFRNYPSLRLLRPLLILFLRVSTTSWSSALSSSRRFFPLRPRRPTTGTNPASESVAGTSPRAKVREPSTWCVIPLRPCASICIRSSHEPCPGALVIQSGSQSAVSDLTAAAGWTILNCDPKKADQDIRLVCHDPSKGCDHVNNDGAAGTIVRLPKSVRSLLFLNVELGA